MPVQTSSSPSPKEPRGSQLTRKQRQVLTAIQRFSTRKGYMPSVRELGRELGGLAPATVQHHLTSLRQKGYLDHDGAAHGMRLSGGPGMSMPLRPQDELASFDGGSGGSDSGRRGGGRESTWDVDVPGMQVTVPLLGVISAGKPLEATEESDEYVPIPASLARGSAFVLRVAGDSMIEDAILDGDLIVVQPCERVDNGQVAVALLPDGTATLKRIHVEKDRIRLQPANSAMAPLYVDSVRIRGRVVGLIRSFN